MNSIDWSLWLKVVQWIVTLAIGFYAWLVSRYKANSDAISNMKRAHDSRLDAISDRVTVVETTVKHMPDAESIGKVHARLDKQTETLHELVGGVTVLTNQLAMLNEHLLDKERK